MGIKRRKAPSLQPFPSQQAPSPCVELGRFGLDKEMDRLVATSVIGTEASRDREEAEQMMNFLARAMQNPSFIPQLVQQNDKRREFEEAIGKKRLNRINQGPRGCFVGESSQSREGLNLIKIEPKEFEVSELEALALEMQGFGRARKEIVEEHGEFEHFESGDKEIAMGFWEDLLNEKFDEEGDNQLGHLASSPK
ncbi:Heat stress transcription factor A-6b [Camellia lanceoleosa]|uniref:Heat stress transcription factor A-6b n=1 Tax=Camellia lanceoleosa TaxID=1840588 RepID=A0ACC0FUL6_9ERIC|nr:Heat stress transcription factor A-6b [Camellia lanceoleosa]